MGEILKLNLFALYFLYGLSFYTMGVAIALQYRSYSSFRLARSLSLLAAFGILHGLSEWGSVFLPVQIPYLAGFPIWKQIALQRLLLGISNFFLFLFGAKLLADTRGYGRWIFLIPSGLFLGWLLEFSCFVFWINTKYLLPWLLISDSWARYLLALPGGLVTMLALLLQLPEIRAIRQPLLVTNLYLAALAFGLFTLFSGMIVAQEIGPISSYLNHERFQAVTGLPVELFRTISAFLGTWSMTRILAIFDWEKQKRMAESQRREAAYQERERFARDLHDDIIQSIYGVGLNLQVLRRVLATSSEDKLQKLDCAISHLDRIIQALRQYIQSLEEENDRLDIKTALQGLIQQIAATTDVKIELEWELSGDREWCLQVPARDWPYQLRQIVSEALSNVIKHARATRAVVRLSCEEERLVVTISDDGCGFQPHSREATQGRGLSNLRRRALLLGGDFELISAPGRGTCLVVSIPVNSRK